jgi:hypothetical protein
MSASSLGPLPCVPVDETLIRAVFNVAALALTRADGVSVYRALPMESPRSWRLSHGLDAAPAVVATHRVENNVIVSRRRVGVRIDPLEMSSKDW